MAGNSEAIRKSRDEAEQENWFEQPVNKRIPALWPGEPAGGSAVTTSQGRGRIGKPVQDPMLDYRLKMLNRTINDAGLMLNEQGVKQVVDSLYQVDPVWYMKIDRPDQAKQYLEEYIAAIMPTIYDDYGAETPFVIPEDASGTGNQ